jgi:hypothetical protein
MTTTTYDHDDDDDFVWEQRTRKQKQSVNGSKLRAHRKHPRPSMAWKDEDDKTSLAKQSTKDPHTCPRYKIYKHEAGRGNEKHRWRRRNRRSAHPKGKANAGDRSSNGC